MSVIISDKDLAQLPSKLATMPQEIRNKIIGLLLDEENVTDIIKQNTLTSSLDHFETVLKSKYPVQLFRLNKTLSGEFLDFHYKEHSFVVVKFYPDGARLLHPCLRGFVEDWQLFFPISTCKVYDVGRMDKYGLKIEIDCPATRYADQSPKFALFAGMLIGDFKFGFYRTNIIYLRPSPP
jgi:hypothetical protein